MPTEPNRKPRLQRLAGKVARHRKALAAEEVRQLGRIGQATAQAQERITFLTGLYATLYQVNQAILRCRETAALFQETVRICADFGQFDLAWIGVPDGQANRMRVAAGSGPGQPYLDDLEMPLDAGHPKGRGPTPTSLREGRTIVIDDWGTDPRVAVWRERPTPFSFQASASLPIRSAGRTVAVLALYSRMAHFFAPERLQLLDSLVGDLGFALDKMAAEDRRMNAERALQASEARFRASFERAVAAKSIATTDGRLVRVNEAYCRMMGYSRAELEGTSFMDLIHPEDRPATLSFARASMADASVHRMEKRYLHKHGHEVWGDVSAALVRDQQGEPLYFVADLVDISGRKALEKVLQELNQGLERRVAERTRQLEAANQDLEAFAYGVSHDLRAPLRSLAGFSELLLQEDLDLPPAKRIEYLHRIHASALRMSRIIDDLLRLARFGHEHLHRRPLDLAAIARETFDRLQEGDPVRSVTLELEAPLMVHGDARLLNVLMGNLLENAWKFTAREPRATVAVGRDPAQAGVLFVKDNGVGFPMAHVEQIFAPFRRLHKASEFPGTGIGLALAERVVRHHGGRIWAQSEPGQGATIFFSLCDLPI